MDTILKEYRKKLEDVLNLAFRYLHEEELQNDLKYLLKLTERNLTDKWITRKKVVRTKFALEAFPNYPMELLSISLYADAIVNLLDDILDELMEKDERALHVVEIAKVLTALFMDEMLDRNIMKLYSEYFSKILCVAVSEMHYSKKMQNAEKKDELIQHAISCYNYRAYDVDIFFELPMYALYGEIDRNIVELGRTFRSANLIVKDYFDIDHDLKNKTMTPLTVVKLRDDVDLEKHVCEILDYYLIKSDEIFKRVKKEKQQNLHEIAETILNMIEREADKLK